MSIRALGFDWSLAIGHWCFRCEATAMFSPSIQKLIEQFSKFPAVGPRTASRFVFYLLSRPKDEIKNLTKAIEDINGSVKICLFCYKPFEGEKTLCEICSDPRRDKSLLCLVEKEVDLSALEATKKYSGIYFILGGTVSRLKKEELRQLRVKELIERLKNTEKFGLAKTQFREVILATNPTTEGEATELYLQRLLKPLKIKITRLGRGLPIGGELEYADEETLSNALEGRK